jgi:peroxiredoxin
MNVENDLTVQELEPAPRSFGRWLGIVLTVTVLAGVVYAAWVWSGGNVRSSLGGGDGGGVPEVGQVAPDFSLPLLNGGSVRLSDLRGQPVVLNFWATWCPPCIEEMPALEALWQQTSGQVVVLGVDQGERVETVARFLETTAPVTFPILMDPDQVVGYRYYVRSLPTTFFIDANGIIREIRVGGPLAESFLQERGRQLIEGR